VLVGAAFLAVLAVIVGILWGIGKLATTGRRTSADNTSLVEHWEEPAERLANIKRAMEASEVGASAAELRDFHRLLTRVTTASRGGDQAAFVENVDLNLMVRRISQHPLVREDRDFSAWTVKSELESGLSPFEQVGEFSIVRVERAEREGLAVLYTVDWDYSLATACRWWLVRDGRNWKLFDWERLDYEQSLAHTWAIRDAIQRDTNSYNYTVLRGAIDSTPQVPGGRVWGPQRSGRTDLASLIDDPLPEAVHDAAMFDLAWALIGEGRPADAIKATEALHRPQDHPGYLIIRARALGDLGRYREALADAQAYEQIAGPDPLALEQAATALAELNRHREAAECWRTMLRLAPNHGAALAHFCRLADADQRQELEAIVQATRLPLETAAQQAQTAIYEDDPELFEVFASFVTRTASDSPAAIAMQAQRLHFERNFEQAAAEFQRAAAAEFRPDAKQQFFNSYLDSMRQAGKIAAGYAAASDPEAAFDYLTAGWEEDESELTDAQLKELLDAHRQRMPGHARAEYLTGQLLLRQGDYAGAAEQFRSAMEKAEEEEKEYYRSSRIEALVHLGQGADAYQKLGGTTEVFREVASELNSQGRWDELKLLIDRHRAAHSEDRWCDYYEAFYDRERDAAAAAAAAIESAEQGDDQLKAYCKYIKRPMFIEAGRMQELLASADERPRVFVELARELMQNEDWTRLDELARTSSAVIFSDAEALDVWTDALVIQGRLAEAEKALAAPPSERPVLYLERELAERHVRCLVRLGKHSEARQIAERARSELGSVVPPLIVDLAEKKIAAVRTQLDDLLVQKALAVQPIDQDPELVHLLLSPELADVRSKLTLPLESYGSGPDRAIIVLLSRPLALTKEQLTQRLAHIGVEGAQAAEATGGETDGRLSFRVVRGDEAVIVSLGSGPYWEPGGNRRLPHDAQLAKCLSEHRGYVVIERDRTQAMQAGSSVAWQRKLAAELARDGGLAVHAQPSRSSDARLVAVDEALLAELKSGKFLTSRPRAGIEFHLSDRLRYPDNPAAETESEEQAVRRRAARALARKIGAGEATSGQIRVALWRGHARELHWLTAVSARRDEYGRWQLIGELTADSALRPALTSGTLLIVEPYEVLDIRNMNATSSGTTN